jgi:hypothetical protein
MSRPSPRRGKHRSPGAFQKKNVVKATLPPAGEIYRQFVPSLGHPNFTGWSLGLCPFHPDVHPSFVANVQEKNGGWKCFAGCGSGDLINFYMRATGLGFADALRELKVASR